MSSNKDISGLTLEELRAYFENIGEPGFRAEQAYLWLFKRGELDFERWTDFPRALRDRLSELFGPRRLDLYGRLKSKDGTEKLVFKLHDGVIIETVLIPTGERATVCLSSQAGCKFRCVFCASGLDGFKRDLTAGEIVGQVLAVRGATGLIPTNIVVMGMGEPFLNYDNVMKAMAVISDPEGVAIGHRRITISTAGIPPGIARFTAEKRPYRLAVSLNATSDSIRSRIMPVNKKYPLKELMAAAKDYSRKTGGRITFEYVLIRDVNDSMQDAERLLKLLKNLPCKVNLIPYNPGCGTFKRPEDERVSAFLDAIKPLASPVIVRMSRGVDISAACGQLATRIPKNAKKAG